MQVTRRSQTTGLVHTLELDITEEQLHRWQYGGELIQRVFPHLSRSDREFLITGTTQEEWDALFKEEY